jgi:hypothetical protein
MKVTNLVASVAKRLGRTVRRSTASAAPAILAGGLFFAGAASAEVLLFENFDDLVLFEPVSNSESFDFEEAWTDVPPTGWVRDNTDTPLPDIDDPDIGPDEFFGFTFVNREWWVSTAGDQERSFFTLGDGNIMVADADEYDDQPKLDGRGLNENGNVDVPGAMNVFITTPTISLVGFDPASASLKFDSSFRPYDMMTGLVDVSFNNGSTWNNLLTLDLDAFGGANSSLDRVDETVELNLGAPAGATQAQIRFALVDAGNDWWWALDNIEVTADSSGAFPGDFDGDGVLAASDIDALTTAVQDGVTGAQFDVNNDGSVNAADRTFWVQTLKNTYFGDSNLDGEFNSADFVAVFTVGQYEDGVANNSTWSGGDWNGDGEFDSSDFVAAFVAGGYEQGPRAAVASVPEPTGLGLVVVCSAAAFWSVVRRKR